MDQAAPTLHSERLSAAQAQWSARRPHWHPDKEHPPRVAMLADEEAWAFDVHGFLIIKGALRGAELAECRTLAAEGVAPAALATHPVALRYVEQLCGAAWRLEGEAALVDWGAAEASGPRIAGGSVPHDHSRAYYQPRGNRPGWCQGLCAVWALADAPSDGSGVRLLPASHTLNLSIPDVVLSGEDSYLESLGMELQPALQAGDLLLHAATVAHGLHCRNAPVAADPPPLLKCSYLAVFARAADASVDVPFTGEEPFLSELGAEERCVLGLPPAGDSNAAGVGVGQQPALRSDGRVTRLESPPEVAARAGQPYHPSGLPGNDGGDSPAADTAAGEGALNVDPLEFFYWELTGFLVVRGAMDTALLAAANAVLDNHEGHKPVAAAASPATVLVGSSKRMSGTTDPSFQIDLLSELQTPAARAPFIEMLAHPVLVQRLNWMMGGHFRACVHLSDSTIQSCNSLTHPV